MKIILLISILAINVAFGNENEAHSHATLWDLKFNIINFLIYTFLIAKFVVPKLRTTFKETREKVSEGLKLSKKKMDEAQARLLESENLVSMLPTKLSEIELNAGRDLEHFKERSARETHDKIDLMDGELKGRLNTEKINYSKRLNNETAQRLISLSKEKIKQNPGVNKQVNDLSIELLGN